MQVTCQCNHETVNTKDVEFLDIEEGPMGEDLMTFVCPFCGNNHTNVVVSGGPSAEDEAYWSDRSSEVLSHLSSYEDAYNENYPAEDWLDD